MSDILECNVSVVEDLAKKREPLPLAGVYFIQPTSTSVTQMLEDFMDRPLYPSVHIFFTSKASAHVRSIFALAAQSACPLRACRPPPVC
jgi:hypothetical protein